MSPAIRRRPIVVNSRKFDGSIKRSWTAELLGHSESTVVVRGTFDREISHPHLGIIRKGTISVEYFLFERWFSVFRFHEPEGAFRNFYGNVNMPPQFADGVIDLVDLDIDIIVWPDWRAEVLDREEFDANAAKFDYSIEVVKNAENAVDELLALIRQRAFPFNQNGDHLG